MERSCFKGCFCSKAFTLIELLVVVLIIGILAAVAVPQYQKTVEKSRVVQLLVAIKAFAQAEETYYLANGRYTTYFSQLSVGITKGKESSEERTQLDNGATISLGAAGARLSGYTQYVKIDYYPLHTISNDSHVKGGMLTCVARNSDKIGSSICANLSQNRILSNAIGCGTPWSNSLCSRFLIGN